GLLRETLLAKKRQLAVAACIDAFGHSSFLGEGLQELWAREVVSGGHGGQQKPAMRASPEIGAVFADPELLGVGDAFRRCQDMNLDLQLFLRRDGRKTAIVVGGGEGEPRDAPGERKGIVKTAGASAQGALRGQRDEGSAALMQRGSGRRLLESHLPGAAIVVEREPGAMEQRGLRGSVELVRGGREVTHGGVADRVLVVAGAGAGGIVIEGLLKCLDGEA